MVQRSIAGRVGVLALSLLTVIATAPFSLAETFSASPLGAVVTPGSVIVGNAVAPTGTTIFAGDRVTSDDTALIDLNGGSRIEMTKATATFSRQGKTLLVKANQGLLRFNFVKGENVRIDAGKYTFTAVNDSAHVGELGLNRNGQVVMSVTEGVFAALDTLTGARSEADPGNSVVATDQGGQGSITKNGKTLADKSKSFQANELKGKCVVAGSEAYQIVSNAATVITTKGAWQLNTGVYAYKVVDCIEEALVAAGATKAAAGAAATGGAGAAAAGAAKGAAGATAGMSAGKIAAIVAGVGGAVGLGVGIYVATKSP